MVLSRTIRVSTATGVCRGPIIGALNNRSYLTLRSLFVNLCKACQVETMAAIPPSAFSAGRIRETQREDMKLTRTKSKTDIKFFNIAALTELSPLKYNSKLMNSIWGFYNRYSPHNVKKVSDDFAFQAELQPCSKCGATQASNPELRMHRFPVPSRNKENFYQSAVNSGNRASAFSFPFCPRP